MPLVLTEADIRLLLPIEDLIDAMEHVLTELSMGRAQQPLRTVMQVGAQKAYFGVMPAYINRVHALGTKLVAFFTDNAQRGLPTHLATIVLFDPDTGALLALLDGRYITEARTGAVSAVATRYLACTEAPVLAVIGSGVQARSHVEALTRVRSVREVRVWSPNEEHRRKFAASSDARVPMRVCATAEAAVRGASLIVLATSSTTPVIKSDWVSDGAHVCAVGACRPDHREIDPALLARARLVVDSRAGALAEAGDVVLGIREGHIDAAHIVAELGEVVSGAAVGRRTSADVTIFKSLGLAVEDVAAADLAYRRAAECGRGSTIAL